jgi:hypothetical protein
VQDPQPPDPDPIKMVWIGQDPQKKNPNLVKVIGIWYKLNIYLSFTLRYRLPEYE